MELIRHIIVPNYPDKIQVSKSRRPVFYVSEESKIRGKKIVPKSFLNEEKYYFDERGVLFNKITKEPQLANPRSAGKPRYWVVNFQDIWNQNLTKQRRAILVDRVKDIFKPYIREIVPIKEFPIEISIVIFDIHMNVDISNRGSIFTKIIEDLIVKEGKIPDDSSDFVNCSGRCKFVKIDNIEDKKLEIKIYKSNNNPF